MRGGRTSKHRSMAKTGRGPRAIGLWSGRATTPGRLNQYGRFRVRVQNIIGARDPVLLLPGDFIELTGRIRRAGIRKAVMAIRGDQVTEGDDNTAAGSSGYPHSASRTIGTGP